MQSQKYLKKISDRSLTKREYFSIRNGNEPVLRSQMQKLGLNGYTPRRRISNEDLQAHLEKMENRG